MRLLRLPEEGRLVFIKFFLLLILLLVELLPRLFLLAHLLFKDVQVLEGLLLQSTLLLLKYLAYALVAALLFRAKWLPRWCLRCVEALLNNASEVRRWTVTWPVPTLSLFLVRWGLLGCRLSVLV